MSWQVKDEITILNNLKEELTRIRDSLFLNSNISNLPSSTLVGGVSGNQAPIGSGGLSGLQAFPIDDQVAITDIDPSGIATGLFNRIRLTTSNMVVQPGVSSDIKWIDGTLNNGQFIILKPLFGTAFTLKTGGNIAIPGDVVVSGTEVCIIIFYEDVTSPDAEGNYVALKSSGGAGSGYNLVEDEGVAQTVRTTMNFVGAGVTASDIGGKTQISIPGVAGLQTPWLQPIDGATFSLFNMPTWFMDNALTVGFLQNAGGIAQFSTNILHTFDVFIGSLIVPLGGWTINDFNINVPMKVHGPLGNIHFEPQAVPGVPVAPFERILFSDSSDLNKLKVRTLTGVIDLEGAQTNLSNLIATLISQDLTFVFNSLKTIHFDGANVALTANPGGAVLPPAPVAFVNVKIGGSNFKMAYYNV